MGVNHAPLLDTCLVVFDDNFTLPSLVPGDESTHHPHTK